MKNHFIKLADPDLTVLEEQAVVEVLRSGRLVSGPRVEAFESKLAQLTARRFAHSTSSGTAALLVALRALGIGPKSTVVVPALTFPAPAFTAHFLGARVRLCDVDPGTFNLSAQTLEPRLDETVSAVITIDQFGCPAPIEEIQTLVRPLGIPILVDAACSLGSRLNGRPCGSFGIIAALSFHPRKIVTTGEGGAVLTDDPDLSQKMRQMIDQGRGPQGFESIGSNFRLSEMAAAVGLPQLDRLEKTLHHRQHLREGYNPLPLQFQAPLPGTQMNHQTAAAVLPDQLESELRADLIAHLKSENIEAGVASYCIGALGRAAADLGLDAQNTPTALQLHHRAFALPLHTGLEPDDIEAVVDAVRQWPPLAELIK